VADVEAFDALHALGQRERLAQRCSRPSCVARSRTRWPIASCAFSTPFSSQTRRSP